MYKKTVRATAKVNPLLSQAYYRNYVSCIFPFTGPSLGGGGGGGSGGGGSQGGADNIKFAKKPDFLTDKTIKPEHISNLEDDIDPQGSSIDELFSNSNQPPTLLPLDYQLHTKARKAVSKQVKIIKEEPMDCDNSTADTADTGDNVKPVKAVVAPLTEVKGHQTKISDLFTPEDVSTSVKQYHIRIPTMLYYMHSFSLQCFHFYVFVCCLPVEF